MSLNLSYGASLELLRLDKNHICIAFGVSWHFQAFIYACCLSREEVLIEARIHDFEYLSRSSTWTYNERIAKYYILQLHQLLIRQVDISKHSKGFSEDLAHRVRPETGRNLGLSRGCTSTHYRTCSTQGRLETVICKTVRLKLHLRTSWFIVASARLKRLHCLLI